MTIKKLAVLGTVLAGAALLQNKERRERLMRSATDLLHATRERLGRASAAATDAVADATERPERHVGPIEQSASQRYNDIAGSGHNGH